MGVVKTEWREVFVANLDVTTNAEEATSYIIWNKCLFDLDGFKYGAA